MSDIENLIVRRAAEMAEKDGVGVQIVHVFGATSQLSAALAEARDRLINHPGQIADTLSSLLDADEAAATGVSAELRRLVIAARIVAYEDQSGEALEELDKASEAFAELVPWEDEPQEPDADAAAAAAEAERIAAEKVAADAAEAERLAAEKAAADAAESERLAAEKAAADAAEAEQLAAEQAAADAAPAAAAADAKAPAKATSKAK